MIIDKQLIDCTSNGYIYGYVFIKLMVRETQNIHKFNDIKNGFN